MLFCGIPTFPTHPAFISVRSSDTSVAVETMNEKVSHYLKHTVEQIACHHTVLHLCLNTSVCELTGMYTVQWTPEMKMFSEESSWFSLSIPFVGVHIEEIEEDGDAVAITRQNKQKIKRKFAELLMKSCKKFREKQINIKDFCWFIKNLFPPGDFIHKSSSIDDIFSVMSQNKLWDYWNYSLLQDIVQQFVGDDQEVMSWIETYKIDLLHYKATTKLVDYIDSDPSGDDLPSEEGRPEEPEQQPVKYDRRHFHALSFKLEAKFTTHTLQYLDDLWKEFSELYNLSPLVTLLEHVHTVSIVWLIPPHLADQILRKAPPPHSVDFYCKHQITRVEFDGVCIYPKTEEYAEVYLLLLPNRNMHATA